MSVVDDEERSGLPVRLSCGPVYSEHGFIVIDNGLGDDHGYWQVDGAGVAPEECSHESPAT